MLCCSSDFFLPLGQQWLRDRKLKASWACLIFKWDCVAEF